MTQPDLDFFRRRAITIKAEATEGLDAAPDPLTDGFRLFDSTSSTEYDTVERAGDKPHFGNDQFVTANPRASVRGTFELYPPATPGAAANSNAFCERVLLPSGMTVVKNAGTKITRYNPISSGIPCVTSDFFHSGTLLKILGARGDISELGIEIGQRFTGQVSLMGEYVELEAEALPTVTLPDWTPVVSSKRNSELILGTLVKGGTKTSVGAPLVGLHAWGKALRVGFGNQLSRRQYTEKGVSGVGDRKGTFTMRLAKTDITDDFNPVFIRDNNILITAAYRLYENDSKVGLYSELGVRAQIEQVTPTDLEGDYGWEITGRLIPSSAGNDEFYIGFGDSTP